MLSTEVSSELIAGIDEAGRGAVAGPVVAAACIVSCALKRLSRKRGRWSPEFESETDDVIIADSKILDPEQREISFAWIVEHLPFGVGMVDAETIDRIGIKPANHQAMRQAVAMLMGKAAVELLLIDGNDRFVFDIPHHDIIRGDATEPCIAAASIIAKVTRDRWMTEASDRFPQYQFPLHKGYGTPVHRSCLEQHGPCLLHRKTFVRTFMQPKGATQPALLVHDSTSPPTETFQAAATEACTVGRG